MASTAPAGRVDSDLFVSSLITASCVPGGRSERDRFVSSVIAAGKISLALSFVVSLSLLLCFSLFGNNIITAPITTIAAMITMPAR